MIELFNTTLPATESASIAYKHWYLILVVMVIIFVTIVAIMFITRHLDKRDDDINTTRRDKQRVYVKKTLNKFLDDLFSLTEEHINKVNKFDKYNSKETMGEIKAIAKHDIFELRRSRQFREMLAMVDTNELEDLLIELENTNVTLWEQDLKPEIERIIIKYGEESERL